MVAEVSLQFGGGVEASGDPFLEKFADTKSKEIEYSQDYSSQTLGQSC